MKAKDWIPIIGAGGVCIARYMKAVFTCDLSMPLLSGELRQS